MPDGGNDLAAWLPNDNPGSPGYVPTGPGFAPGAQPPLWARTPAPWEGQTTPGSASWLAAQALHSLDNTGWAPGTPWWQTAANVAAIPARAGWNALTDAGATFDQGMRGSNGPLDAGELAQKNALAAHLIGNTAAATIPFGGGDTGALRVFAGPKSATADLSALNKAKAMDLGGHTPEEAKEYAGLTQQLGNQWDVLRGARGDYSGSINLNDPVYKRMVNRWFELDSKQDPTSPEDIFNTTGWFKDKDGQWKYEIPDAGAKLTSDPNFRYGDQFSNIAGKIKIPPNATIGDLLPPESHPDLHAAYPGLASAPVSDIFLGAATGRLGGYDSVQNQFWVAGARPDSEVLSTLLHEVNHYIQGKEGFARGGNPEEFLPAGFQDDYDATKAARDYFHERMREAGANPWSVQSAMDSISAGRDPYPSQEAELEKVLAYHGSDFILDYQDTANRLADMQAQKNEARGKYESLAGEVSSQNVQHRFETGDYSSFPLDTSQGYPQGPQLVKFSWDPAEPYKTALSIDAFHGTPHTFEPVEHNPFGEFRDEAIGSGEGAQAYGYGHYLAGNKGIAEFYRDKLSGGNGVQPVLWQGKNTAGLNIGHFMQDPNEPTSHALERREVLENVARNIENGSSPQGAINIAQTVAREKYQNPDLHVLQDEKEFPIGASAQFKAGHDFAQGLRPEDFTRGPATGNLYHVSIRPDEKDLLDWDRPLADQPGILEKLGGLNPHLQERLAEHAERYGKNSPLDAPEGYTGGQLVRMMEHYNVSDAPEDASMALHEAGIPGIRYLDSSSRDLNPAHGGVLWEGENLTGPEIDAKNRWTPIGQLAKNTGAEPEVVDYAIAMAHKYGDLDKASAAVKDAMDFNKERLALSDEYGPKENNRISASFRARIADQQKVLNWLSSHGDNLRFALPEKGKSNYVIFHPKDLKIMGRNGEMLRYDPVDHDPWEQKPPGETTQ